MPAARPVRRTKICIAASAGGHLSQILRTAEAWRDADHFFVTTSEPERRRLAGQSRAYSVGDANRRHPLKAVLIFFRCLRLMWRERPTAVFSTGALPGCLACLTGRLLGAKIVWLDSFTNVTGLSLSGRIVKPFTSLFLVQWPELAERCPGAEHAGSVL